jgi:1-acyl-sn-glycerol-3-phosphate acyltransferase
MLDGGVRLSNRTRIHHRNCVTLLDCCLSLGLQIGIFNHVSYMDAWVLAWSFCVAGVTFNFMKHVPILGYALRAMQNIYLPPHNDAGVTIDTQAKQPKSVAQMIKERLVGP